MVSTVRPGDHTIEESSLIGLGILFVYLLAGLFFADWHLGEFLSHLTPVTTAYAILFAGLVIAGVAIPVAVYLRYGLRSPLAVSLVIAIGWFIYGTITGVLTTETVFGFTLYLWMVSPILVVFQLLLGGGEYYVRRWDTTGER